MTPTDLEKLLAEVTPAPWNVSAPVQDAPDFMVIKHGDFGYSDCGKYLHASGNISPADARLITMAPDLARKVIAAEKLAAEWQHSANEGDPMVDALLGVLSQIRSVLNGEVTQ